jgi:hypothetical protein
MSSSTSRTVEGEVVLVGGVAVRVELDEGELSIRVSACDPAAEDEQVAISPDRKYGHGTLYTEGELPGEVHGHRFAVYRKRS